MGKLRQEDGEFEGILGCIDRPSPQRKDGVAAISQSLDVGVEKDEPTFAPTSLLEPPQTVS